MKHKIYIGTAVLASAIVPALTFGLLASSLNSVTLAFFVALAHAIVFGLPAYFFLTRKRKLTWYLSICAGYIIGCIVPAIIFFPYKPGQNYDAFVNNKETIIDGTPTIYGWLDYVMATLSYGLFGVLGGFAFWLTLKIQNTPKSSIKNNLISISPHTIIPLFVLVTSVTISMLPTINRDRSCHNPLRSGGSSISPVLSLDISITDDEWPKMTDFFIQFSQEYDLEFKDSSDFKPDVYMTLYLSICHDSGFNFSTAEQRWARKKFRNSIPDPSVRISVFEFGDDTNLKSIAQHFIIDAKERWPNKVSIQYGQEFIE